MYGGGQWTTQNKVLGGAYINFISAARVTTNLSERGVASMPLELDWGADNVMMEVAQEISLRIRLRCSVMLIQMIRCSRCANCLRMRQRLISIS